MLVVPYKGCDDLYIFDLDGTLIDSNGLWMEVDVEFLARRGLAPTAEYEAVEASIFQELPLRDHAAGAFG